MIPRWKLEREFRDSCLGKKQFTVEGDAQKAAAKSAQITGEDWSAYRCRFGEHFHIGHTPTAVRTRKERKRRWREKQKQKTKTNA